MYPRNKYLTTLAILLILMTFFVQIPESQAQDDDVSQNTPMPDKCDDWICSLNTLVWHPDGKMFAIGGDFGVHFYSDTLVLQFTMEIQGVSQIAWSPDGARIAIVSSEVLLIRDMDELTEWCLYGHGQMAWHEDSKRIAYFAPNDEIIVYDLVSNEEVAVFSYADMSRGIRPPLTWDGDSLLLLSSSNVYRWNPFGNNAVETWELPPLTNWGHWWGDSPWNNTRNRLIVTRLIVGNDQIGIWNMETEEAYWGKFHDFFYSTYGIAWSPNDQYIAAATPSDVYILNPDSLETLHTYSFHHTEYDVLIGEASCLEHPDLFYIANHVIWNPDGDKILVVNACRLMTIPIDEILGE